MNFNGQPRENTSEDKKKLIEKLGLKAGKEISLIKRSASSTSGVATGAKITDKLEHDIIIGEPIVFKNGANTTSVQDITENAGAYFIHTRTSIYELLREAEQKGNIEKVADLQQTIKYIESHLSKQPASIQEMWKTMKDKFYSSIEIEDKKFMFTQISGEEVLSLVEDKKNPGKYKTRVFRFSGSDHQWKILPGRRADGMYMKGEETNPLHHYVQSAKLHKDVYKAIDLLPQKPRHFYALGYVPEPQAQDEEYKEHFGDEFEFKEKYEMLKNEEWARFQKFCQEFYGAYYFLVTKGIQRTDYSRSSNFYKMLEKSPAQEMQNIRTYIDELSKNKDDAFIISRYSMNIMETMETNPNVQKLAQVYKKNVGEYLEKVFNLPFPKGMVPDFNITNRTDTYDKPDILAEKKEKNDIHIEEYTVKNSDGDVLTFAMAYDDWGRVYIDNIYDPRVGMNDYGIPEKIVQMGHLVYKPEEYKIQAYGIPDKYKNPETGNKYVDITPLWGKLPVVSKFKEELLKRGVLKNKK